MRQSRLLRFGILSLVLLMGVIWSVSSVRNAQAEYPRDILVDSAWLREHLDDPGLVVLDVRTDDHFDNNLIPGARRLPWRNMRYNDPARGLGGIFIGTVGAQAVLGEHGVARSDTLVLYDDVERDGGATASYVFWVLELLGHQKVMILESGIDGWIEAGYRVEKEPVQPEPVLYQAPAGEIVLRRLADGRFIRERLDDPYYQIVDLRSAEEYLGITPDKALDGSLLKTGHIPTAVNIPYSEGWADPATKTMRSYAQLRELFQGLDPDRGVIVYCHSARRASFGYFMLRLMGVEDVILYDNSWFEWGAQDGYYPVEKRENRFTGALPSPSMSSMEREPSTETPERTTPGNTGNDDGYVSCGG